MKRALLSVAIALAIAFPTFLHAAKPASVAAIPPDAVAMFDAMKAGEVEVKVIPKDSTTGTVTITNKTKKPLTIKLPEAFAIVPVAAQFGGIGGGGGGNNNNNGGGNDPNQGMGGGMMGGMGGMGMGGGGGMGGGFFNVAPEKVGKLKFISVCLEHGKKDPNPRVPYEIRPLESFTNNPQVIETVKMLARGEVDQHSAQAAAWHLANGLSWQELARKIGAKHIGGATEPYFTAAQLSKAFAIAQEAAHRAEKNKGEVKSPGQTDSLSQN